MSNEALGINRGRLREREPIIRTELISARAVLVVFSSDFEEGLRVGADGACGWGLGADDDVTAVAAFPHLDFALFEDGCSFHVLEEGAVAFLVALLDGGDGAELLGEGGKAFGFGSLRKVFVHVGPFVVFAIGGSLQVGGGVTDAVKFLEPQLGVFLFVVGGLQEQFGDLFVAFLLGAASKVGVLVAGLGFACKGGLEVLFGLGSGVLVCHKFLFLGCGLLLDKKSPMCLMGIYFIISIWEQIMA